MRFAEPAGAIVGTMDYRRLGDSGLVVSALGVGCNSFGARTSAEEVVRIVDAAEEHGVTFFDTADSYSRGESERLLGQALRGRRNRFVIATKFGMDMGGANGPDFGARGSRRYVRVAVEESLRRLDTDFIDLIQFHTPDRGTPLEETLEVLDDLVTEGKVLHIGSSNRTAWEIVDADWIARSNRLQRFISSQNEYSLYNRSAEAELVPACRAMGIGILPYFPLAYGLLTGKYRRGEKAPEGSRLSGDSQAARLQGADFDKVEALQAYADERGISLLSVALGGLAAQPAVGSVISGISRPEQIAANVEAIEWEPSAADLEALDEVVPRGSGTGYASFATSR